MLRTIEEIEDKTWLKEPPHQCPDCKADSRNSTSEMEEASNMPDHQAAVRTSDCRFTQKKYKQQTVTEKEHLRKNSIRDTNTFKCKDSPSEAPSMPSSSTDLPKFDARSRFEDGSFEDLRLPEGVVDDFLQCWRLTDNEREFLREMLGQSELASG